MTFTLLLVVLLILIVLLGLVGFLALAVFVGPLDYDTRDTLLAFFVCLWVAATVFAGILAHKAGSWEASITSETTVTYEIEGEEL